MILLQILLKFHTVVFIKFPDYSPLFIFNVVLFVAVVIIN